MPQLSVLCKVKQMIRSSRESVSLPYSQTFNVQKQTGRALPGRNARRCGPVGHVW